MVFISPVAQAPLLTMRREQPTPRDSMLIRHGPKSGAASILPWVESTYLARCSVKEPDVPRGKYGI